MNKDDVRWSTSSDFASKNGFSTPCNLLSHIEISEGRMISHLIFHGSRGNDWSQSPAIPDILDDLSAIRKCQTLVLGPLSEL